MFEDMPLEDWTQLSGVTQLTLRHVTTSHHAMLVAVLPRLMALRSLVLQDPWYPQQEVRCKGAHCLFGCCNLHDEPCHAH
jgi:hypothetical protein